MENSLIVLVIIASVVYKIYSNYKEEMEKSAQRNLKRPNTVPAPAHGQQSPPVPYRPEVIIQEVENPFTKKSNTIQDIPDEVQRARQLRKEKLMATPKKTTEESLVNYAPIQFDLRQAVIQAAILERPYN